MRIAIFLGLLRIATTINAQQVSLRGQLLDSAHNVLPSATVLLLDPADSTLLNFTSSDGEGKFAFVNIKERVYLLKISHVGFSTFERMVKADSESTDLGKIVLRPVVTNLDEITVVGETAPVVIKRDTVEFNARAFKTNENAIVEDLLKKLPGVEVDNDGTIRAQGEQVRRVTVDGKEFFGSDPKLATRNLPANAISKVQIYDKKSDQSTFTGIDDGQREKAINLELKEEKRKGVFGAVSVGAGTDSRYAGRASVNSFRKKKQISTLAMANNINDQGFGIEEYLNFTGGARRMASGGVVKVDLNGSSQAGVPLNLGNRPSGFMGTYAGGVNFNREFNNNTEVAANYFYNHLDHRLNENTFRENYFSSGVYTFAQNSSQDNTNDNHRLNLSLDQRLDSLNSLKLTTTASYNAATNATTGFSYSEGAQRDKINTSTHFNASSENRAQINADLLWRHRFAKKGRTFSTALHFSSDASDRNGTLDAKLWNQLQGDSTLSQKNLQRSTSYSYGIIATYTEPLGNRKYVEAVYAFRTNRNSFLRNVFDLRRNEQLESSAVSTDYLSAFKYHRAGLNFRINRKHYNGMIGSSIQQAFLDGEFRRADTSIERSYVNVLPALRFNFAFSTSKNLTFDFETNVQEPSIQQLQPVLDNSDPLNLYIGNPNLRPSYVQTVRAHYGTFSPLSFISFMTFAEVVVTRNAITTAQSINPQGIRLTTPVNVDSYRSSRLHASFGFPIKKIKSRIAISTNAMLQNGSVVIDDRVGSTSQKTIDGRLRYDLQFDDALSIGLAANVSRQRARFDTQAHQIFFNNVYTADINLTVAKNFQLSPAFELLEYKNQSANYAQIIPLLNLSLSMYVLKAKSGEIRISATNLLDRNVGVMQAVGINYLERRETNSLGRYYMLTFIYALNKQLNPMGMRRGGAGMMRIMH